MNHPLTAILAELQAALGDEFTCHGSHAIHVRNGEVGYHFTAGVSQRDGSGGALCAFFSGDDANHENSAEEVARQVREWLAVGRAL